MITNEQKKIVDRCDTMLRIAMKGFKRIVFHLNPDGGPSAIDYEIHGKIKIDSEDRPCKVVNTMDRKL